MSEIHDHINLDPVNNKGKLLQKIALHGSYENAGFVTTENISYSSELHYQDPIIDLENCAKIQKSSSQDGISCNILVSQRTSDQDEISTNSSISISNPITVDEHNRNNLSTFFYGNVPTTETENVSRMSSAIGLDNILDEHVEICETPLVNKISILVSTGKEIGATAHDELTRQSTTISSHSSVTSNCSTPHIVPIHINERSTHSQILNRSPPHSLNATQPSSNVVLTSYENTAHADMVPDILHSHISPSYLTFPSSRTYLMRPQGRMRSNNQNFFRPPFFRPVLSSRNTRQPTRDRITEESHKSCCGMIMTQTVSIRWFILMIAFVGLCCVIVGIVLGALKGSSGANSDDHITVALLMIGVGIVLITVSGVAWRLTSHDAPTCRTMLGVNPEPPPENNQRFRPRVPHSHNRSQHPFGAMLYPEFQYRPPPPSYQASMQDYRLRLLLLDRRAQPVNSPPPTYRSNASPQRAPLATEVQHNPSLPPSYRSRTSAARSRPTLETMGFSSNNPPTINSSRGHSRNPSITLSLLSHDSMFLGSAHSRLTEENTNGSDDIDLSVSRQVTKQNAQTINNNESNTDILASIEVAFNSNPGTALESIPTISSVVGSESTQNMRLSSDYTNHSQNEDLEYL